MSENILILPPHTDDAEWGCGASISRWVRMKNEVHHVAFSAAEESVPRDLDPNITRQEFISANKILGIPKENATVLDYKVRHFPSLRQDILEQMIKLREKIQPSLVICPSSFDTHQDHKTIYEETFRAFKKCSILGFEMPWNNSSIRVDYYNSVEQEDVDKKIAAVNAYESQIFKAPRFSELISSLALLRGAQVSRKSAEAFETIRIIHDI